MIEYKRVWIEEIKAFCLVLTIGWFIGFFMTRAGADYNHITPRDDYMKKHGYIWNRQLGAYIEYKGAKVKLPRREQ